MFLWACYKFYAGVPISKKIKMIIIFYFFYFYAGVWKYPVRVCISLLDEFSVFFEKSAWSTNTHVAAI